MSAASNQGQDNKMSDSTMSYTENMKKWSKFESRNTQNSYQSVTNPYEKIQKGFEYRDPLTDALHAMNENYKPIKYCADKYQAPIRAQDSKVHKRTQKKTEP